MKSALDQGKKLIEYEKTKNEQLTIFTFFEDKDQHYSNTMDLYDAIPKYVWGKKEYDHGKYLKSLQREFEHKGVKYNVVLTPARLVYDDGTEKEYFPGQREELIEDALRKLACDKQLRGVLLDTELGLVYSIYQLKKELKRQGHNFSSQEIKEALLICRGTGISVQIRGESKTLINDSLFSAIGFRDIEDKDSKAFVRFNLLVTKALNSGAFRLINYEKCMSYRRALARWLFKRLSHNYRQASFTKPYSIKHSTIMRDSGMKRYDKITNEIREVKKAFEAMKNETKLKGSTNALAPTLVSAKISLIYDAKKKNKVIDAIYELRPHPSFIKDIKYANKRESDAQIMFQDNIPTK